MEAETTTGLTDRLREHGLRVTSQRRAILGVIEAEEEGHLSAERVYERAVEQLPELARATVYNALNELVRAGLLRRVEGLGATLYDRNLDDTHHHFHCFECGRLFDVDPAGAAGITLLGGGFEVHTTEIRFQGRCADCASR